MTQNLWKFDARYSEETVVTSRCRIGPGDSFRIVNLITDWLTWNFQKFMKLQRWAWKIHAAEFSGVKQCFFLLFKIPRKNGKTRQNFFALRANPPIQPTILSQKFLPFGRPPSLLFGYWQYCNRIECYVNYHVNSGSQCAAGENFEVCCMFSSVLPLK